MKSFSDPTNYLKSELSRFWWMPMIVGLISLGLGIWTFCSPATSIGFLACVFAAGLCVAGFFNLTFSLSARNQYGGWGWTFFVGLLDIVAGIWLFALPEKQMIYTFVMIVGIWIIVLAVSELFQSFMLIKRSPWWIIWMILLLIAVIVIGSAFLTNPIEGGVIVWFWLGLSLILFGFYRISFALHLKTLK